GVEPDAAQALAWYRRSAEAGNPSAKLALAELEAGGAAAKTQQTSVPPPESAASATVDEPAASQTEVDAELAYAAEPSSGNEEMIAQLLGLAADQAEKLALTTPEGDNAYETYQLILSLQPDNKAALAGIEQIGVKYVELAERARSRGGLEQARLYADKAVKLAPGHPEVVAIDAALRDQEQPAEAPAAPAAPAPSVAGTTSGTESGAQASDDGIEVSAISGLSVAAGGTESLAVNRAQAPKPELLTSGLLYAVSGLDSHQAGNYDEAIEFYTLAIEAGDLPDRSLAYVYNNRGASYRNLGRYNKAIEDYDAAIRLNPDYATAFYNRGIAYDRKGFYGLAIDDFDTAIRLDPDLSDAYNQRGLAYVRDGRYDIAIENFSQAINLDPELDSAYFNRGLAYHSKGDTDRAAEDIKKSHALNPDNPQYGEKLRELGIL
ncbi:MAG: tetratricopeptide repeat protein, partial [Kiloniellales bacterium]|nr:tetratricopeptide repeat protein [Kiloniellales bacterium]